MAARDTRLTLKFSIEDGETTFDVENGDGTNCEALAAIFTEDGDVLEMGHKPEYNSAHTVGVSRRTT